MPIFQGGAKPPESDVETPKTGGNAVLGVHS